MVYRVDDTVIQSKLDLIAKTLSERCPEYAGIMESTGNGYDADSLLLERGIVSENELLQLYTEILGINVPSITIPVRPGRNFAIIIEIAAMNSRQKKMGYNTAEEFNKRLMGQINGDV